MTPTALLSFYGDDFTGSTDALESLALAGLRTILFTSVPTRQTLAAYPDLQAFGVAGMTRSMPPDEMDRELRPVLAALLDLGTPIVHYKVCSTFDSSPTVGSIGRVIDIASEVFQPKFVPVLVGAPSLGRYCVFGNLFARCGSESEPYRLDRHPSMSRHPVTPMNESDLRVHLAKQTSKSIDLFDVVQLASADPDERFERLLQAAAEIVLLDLLYEAQLPPVGRLLARHAEQGKPLFIVGSSGVESALCAHWNPIPRQFAPPSPVTAVLIVCGSCSPVSAAQMEQAVQSGFEPVSFTSANVTTQATRSLNGGRSVIIHTRNAATAADKIGASLGRMVREVLQTTTVQRILIAGGDTSGSIARALDIESLEMIAPLTRGAPICRATAPGSPAHGREFVFKGGQIGPVDLFTSLKGTPS